jgi:F-type H+-transporting ATPase subunit b
MYTTLIVEGMPLGLSFIEILIHMFNLAILIVGIRLLLYKPVKKFMEKRALQYKQAEEESEQKKKEAEDLKLQYEKLVEDSRQNAITITKEATVSAMIQADEILENAKNEAERRLKRAEEEIAHMNALHKEELSDAVSDLAVDMASRILQREVKPEDNDDIIENLIRKWKD